MLPALEAILGHRSAHSLATGPVIAEPGKKVNTLLRTGKELSVETTSRRNHYQLNTSATP